MTNSANELTPEQLAMGDFDRIFSQFPLTELNGKRLFMTGCTGFFGFWLLMAIHYLNELGANIKVVALSRNPDRFLTRHPFFHHCQWLSFCQGDVTDYSPPNGQFDLFIHGATDTSPDAIASPLQLFQSMFNGTKHVLDHATSSKAQRVLIVSSGAVYGEQPGHVDKISEYEYYVGSSLDVNNVYGEGKRAMEMLSACYADAHDIEIMTARCFAFIGYGLPKHLAISQLINDVLYADEITVKGDGMPVRSYLYAADLAVWLLTILTRGENVSAYNVGSDVGMTIAEHAAQLRGRISPQKDISILGSGSNKQQARQMYIPNVEKAGKELSLKVWTSLNDAIEKSSSHS